MPGDDWWTGSPEAGLRRALEMGGPLPPGTVSPEMMSEYRLARTGEEPWAEPVGPSRGDVLMGWAEQEQRRRQAMEDAARQFREWYAKHKGQATAEDAGNALARSIT